MGFVSWHQKPCWPVLSTRCWRIVESRMLLITFYFLSFFFLPNRQSKPVPHGWKAPDWRPKNQLSHGITISSTLDCTSSHPVYLQGCCTQGWYLSKNRAVSLPTSRGSLYRNNGEWKVPCGSNYKRSNYPTRWTSWAAGKQKKILFLILGFLIWNKLKWRFMAHWLLYGHEVSYKFF